MMSERTVAAKFSPDRTAVKTSNFSSHGNLQPALHITLHQYRYNIDTPPIHAHRFCYVCTDEQRSCPFCTDQMVVVAAFSSCARILEEWLTTHSLPMLFLCLWVEIRSRTLIPLLRPGSVHNGSASWDDCGWRAACELVSRQVPILCLHSGTVSPLHWVKGVCVVRCNLPLALLADWPGSFTCHCDNTGWNGHQISQHTKLTLENNILPPFLLGFELATFQLPVWYSTNKWSQLPMNEWMIQQNWTSYTSYFRWISMSFTFAYIFNSSHVPCTTFTFQQPVLFTCMFVNISWLINSQSGDR